MRAYAVPAQGVACPPKTIQAREVKAILYTIGRAPTKEKALSACEHFLRSWLEKQTEAAECPGVGKEEFVCFPYSPSGAPD
jgi:hypothetical protein